MDMKHTPGPWEIDTDTRPAEICTVHGLPPQTEDGQTFAYVRGALGYWDATPEENLANVRLIAAAPELLAALIELERQADLSLDYRPEFRRAIADAHSVVAKATGLAPVSQLGEEAPVDLLAAAHHEDAYGAFHLDGPQ